ncbi:hypothetical protein BpHYR1_052097 [Brachionus plicatilis]|uniref:Uncharacterized protein n=1 Tax=Brachionus plicatilis TaxID=10195 RepID=A0A3M7RPC3_BRAPC|nr:hypothetical protein BpHYR1_052097 [Brachionus plicatilis]
MNFISRYKSNPSRQTVLQQAALKPQAVKANLTDEILADAAAQNSNDAKAISTLESVILFKGDTCSKMPKKDKKRQSKSASSMLRRLLTCGGVVASCSGTSANKSASNSRRSSRSGHLDIQIPDIVLTHPECDEKMTAFFSESEFPTGQCHEDQTVPEDKQMVLPVIKLNDDFLISDQCEECIVDEESEDENAIEDNFDEYSDEDEESDEECQNNVASIVIEEADEAYLNDTQVFEEEESSVDKEAKLKADLSSTTLPSFSFEIHSDDQDKSESMPKSEEAEAAPKSKSCPKMAGYNSKFLTANNILTDRGCLVNIRTGSFNLGCQSTASSTSLSQDKCANDEELIDSHQFFSSLQHESSEFKNSASNYSFRSYNGSLESNALNLLVPFLLIKNRRKSANLREDKSNENLFFDNESSGQSALGAAMFAQATGNLLSVSCNADQDQLRRCSHDPNIEKLHKTYIENVKLSSGEAFASNTNIYSAAAKHECGNGTKKNAIKSLKFSENFLSLDSSQKFNSLAETEDKFALEAEKADVLNEIYKVDKWLIDNRNNHVAQKKELCKKIVKRLPSMTISEDEDNLKSVDSSNNSSKMKVNLHEDENDDTSTSTNPKPKYASEANDSAIDIRSYG